MVSAERQWFEGLSSKGIRPGLEAMSVLLEDLGSPQSSMRAIHVAGSDGKGSTCCMLESILLSAGYRTGMFTSPHIISVNECIKVDGEEISDDDLDSCIREVRESSERTGCDCTSFEALTLCAFLYFRKKSVDIAIIEVGMGGRLDATNVVDSVVTVINNIGLEHQAYLGDSIEEIASEKAGIMKPGIPCVTMNSGKALEVIEQRSEDLGCPLICVCPEDIQIVESSADHISMRYCCKNYRVGLPGEFQSRNAALAIEAIKALSDSKRIEQFITIGLDSATWPCRMQKLDGYPIVLDVTHTRKGAEYLSADIGRIYGKVVLVTGMLSDKDLDGVAETLSKIATKVFVSSPDSPRAADKDELAACYRRFHNDVRVFDTIGEAVETALKDDDIILVTGSFRTAEDCLRWLRRTR